DVGRLVAHQAEGIRTDVGNTDIVAPEHENVRPPSRGRKLRLGLRLSDRDGIRRPNRRCRCEGGAAKEDASPVEDVRALVCSVASVPVAHAILLCLTTHRKPRWLVDVSTACAWRAAGR